jgi:hypothetical protein
MPPTSPPSAPRPGADATKSDLALDEELGAKQTELTSDVEEELDERAEEKKLVRKLDLHLIPVVMLLYLLSFLDR